MLRFLSRFRRSSRDQAVSAGANTRDPAELLRPLRSIQPDAGAKAKGRAALLAAVAEAKTEKNKPRLAGVRAFTLAAAGLAGSTVLVASAATGSDPATMVRDVADWSTTALDRPAEQVHRESVTVRSYDLETRIVEATNDRGEDVRIRLPDRDAADPRNAEGLESGTRIDVTVSDKRSSDEPARATDVTVVSTPQADLAREPAQATDEPPIKDGTNQDAGSAATPAVRDEPPKQNDAGLAANDAPENGDQAPTNVATATTEPTMPPTASNDYSDNLSDIVGARPSRTPTAKPTQPPAVATVAEPTPTSTLPPDNSNGSADNQDLSAELPRDDKTEADEISAE